MATGRWDASGCIKYGNVRADGSSSHCGCEGPRFEPETSPKDKQATSFAERLIGNVMKRRRWTNVANISI